MDIKSLLRPADGPDASSHHASLGSTGRATPVAAVKHEDDSKTPAAGQSRESSRCPTGPIVHHSVETTSIRQEGQTATLVPRHSSMPTSSINGQEAGLPAPRGQKRPLPRSTSSSNDEGDDGDEEALLPGEPAKKQSKWSEKENDVVLRARARGDKWNEVSKLIPGRSGTACRLHYQNFLEKKPEWTKESIAKLARLWERHRKEIFKGIAKDLGMPWRTIEAKLFELGPDKIAELTGTEVFRMKNQGDARPQRPPVTVAIGEATASGLRLVPHQQGPYPALPPPPSLPPGQAGGPSPGPYSHGPYPPAPYAPSQYAPGYPPQPYAVNPPGYQQPPNSFAFASPQPPLPQPHSYDRGQRRSTSTAPSQRKTSGGSDSSHFAVAQPAQYDPRRDLAPPPYHDPTPVLPLPVSTLPTLPPVRQHFSGILSDPVYHATKRDFEYAPPPHPHPPSPHPPMMPAYIRLDPQQKHTPPPSERPSSSPHAADHFDGRVQEPPVPQPVRRPSRTPLLS